MLCRAVPLSCSAPKKHSLTQMKRIFLEGNPYLLALTMAVSMLHSVFDFLAFKNDIGFWKENKSMEGLSARSIVINAVCQLVGPVLLTGCVCVQWCRCCTKALCFWLRCSRLFLPVSPARLGAAASLAALSVCERFVWGCGTFSICKTAGHRTADLRALPAAAAVAAGHLPVPAGQ